MRKPEPRKLVDFDACPVRKRGLISSIGVSNYARANVKCRMQRQWRSTLKYPIVITLAESNFDHCPFLLMVAKRLSIFSELLRKLARHPIDSPSSAFITSQSHPQNGLGLIANSFRCSASDRTAIVSATHSFNAPFLLAFTPLYCQLFKQLLYSLSREF